MLESQYTGPRPSGEIAIAYGTRLLSRIEELLGYSSRTNAQTVDIINRHMCDLHNEFKIEKDICAEYTPTAELDEAYDRLVIKLCLNGWHIGTIQ